MAPPQARSQSREKRLESVSSLDEHRIVQTSVSGLDEHRCRRRLGVGPKAALDDRQGGDLARVSSRPETDVWTIRCSSRLETDSRRFS